MFPCAHTAIVKNQWVSFATDLDPVEGETRMLMCALDYKQTDNPLTCTFDGRNVQELAGACGIADVRYMQDEECQKANVEDAIRSIGGRSAPGDCFIFYYSGHGTNLADQSGDEEDGQDEALCFVDGAGQVNFNSCMSDDDFADIITTSFEPGVKILILTDCCHSGSIADLGKPSWDGFEAISITGCMDNQTSGDIGTGGIFTHSMLLGIEELEQQGEADYSVGMLFNATLKFDDEKFDSKQDITLQCSNDATSSDFVWPLNPTRPYVSPMRKAQASGRGIGDEGGAAAQGIPPALAAFVGNLDPPGDMDLKKQSCTIM